MRLTNTPPKIVGNHLITGICIETFEDLESIIRTHGSVSLNHMHNCIYGASVVMNWNYSIVSRYIREERMLVTLNIKNLTKQERPKRNYNRKFNSKTECSNKILLQSNPLYDTHIEQNTKELDRLNIQLINEPSSFSNNNNNK